MDQQTKDAALKVVLSKKNRQGMSLARVCSRLWQAGHRATMDQVRTALVALEEGGLVVRDGRGNYRARVSS